MATCCASWAKNLGEEGLPLPRAPDEGREEQFARAREWMSPKHDA